MARRTLIAIVVVEVVAAVLAAATIVDVRAHMRGEEGRVVNKWGFRGKPRLKALGRRIAFVGGSAAYGYGVDATKAVPYYLQYFLERESQRRGHPAYIEVANLAA